MFNGAQTLAFYQKEVIEKYAGTAICLAIILSAVSHVGINLYNDFMSMTFVLGGALGFALLKNEIADMPHNFGDGAVYFGWLGLLVDLVAIASNAFGALGNVEEMGPALAISMLPLFYVYTFRQICIAVGKAKPVE